MVKRFRSRVIIFYIWQNALDYRRYQAAVQLYKLETSSHTQTTNFRNQRSRNHTAESKLEIAGRAPCWPLGLHILFVLIF